MNYNFTASVVLLLNIAGCATPIKPPTQAELNAADFGTPLTADEFNSIVEPLSREQLNDPSSLLYYGATKTVKYWAVDGSNVPYFGYFGCFEYNGKNRMGGYGEKSKSCLFFKDGAILQRYEIDSPNSIRPPLNTIVGTIQPRHLKNNFSTPEKPTANNQTIIGRAFNPTLTDKLTAGESTIKDAVGLFGDAQSQSQYPNGTTLLQWQYIAASAKPGARSAHLAILFDNNQKMVRIAHKFVQ